MMAAMTTTPRRAPATIPTTAPVEGPSDDLFELARAVPEATPVEVEVLPLTTTTVVRVERGAVVSSAADEVEETEVTMREVVDRVVELELELVVVEEEELVVVEEEVVVEVVVGSVVVEL